MGSGERLGWGSRQGGRSSAHLPICLSLHPPIRLSVLPSFCPSSCPPTHPSVRPSLHPSTPPSLPPSVHPRSHPSVPPSTHPSVPSSPPPTTTRPPRGLTPAVGTGLPPRSPTWSPRWWPQGAAGCWWLSRGGGGEERCHLPRVIGATLPWRLVALVLLSPIKAALWPGVQRAAPALGPSSGVGEERPSRGAGSGRAPALCQPPPENAEDFAAPRAPRPVRPRRHRPGTGRHRPQGAAALAHQPHGRRRLPLHRLCAPAHQPALADQDAQEAGRPPGHPGD